MATLRLIRLVCNDPEDSTGDDDVYIFVNGHNVWGPKPMDSSPADKKTRAINYSKDFGSRVKFKVQLWEEDKYTPFDDDDCLGTFEIPAKPTDPEQVHRFKGSKSGFKWDYELYWQVDA